MKYHVSINQEVLSKYHSLDIKDGAILDYLIAFCSSDDKNIRQLTIKERGNDYKYTWINYNHLIREMPILRIKSKEPIARRIKKIEKVGFIKTFRAPDMSLYIRLTPKIKELYFKIGNTPEKSSKNKAKSEGVWRNKQGVFGKTNSTNIISFKHKYIYNNINKKNLKKLKSLKQKLLKKKEMLSPKSRTKAQEETSKQLRKKT